MTKRRVNMSILVMINGVRRQIRLDCCLRLRCEGNTKMDIRHDLDNIRRLVNMESTVRIS